MSSMPFGDSVTESPGSMVSPHSCSDAYSVIITSGYLDAANENTINDRDGIY